MDLAEPHNSPRLSRLALASLLAALGAMAVDHLLGTDREEGESGVADPATFAISALLVLATAALLFGWVVPRALSRGPERAALVGLACSALAIVPGVAFAWLGFPFVVAGAGADLGQASRRGHRRVAALGAVALGAGFLVLGTVAYTYGAVKGISEL